jgi:hypothetical protein
MVSITKANSILSMGEGFYTWLRKEGENSIQLTKEAQESGTKLHHIIEQWIVKNRTPKDSRIWYLEQSDDISLTEEEINKLQGFINFDEDFKPKYIATEITVAIPEIQVAGTIDIVCEIENKIYVVDIKTGSGLHHNNELQIAFYQRAYQQQVGIKVDGRVLLHLKADTRNKYNFKEIKKTLLHDYRAMLHAKELWMWDNPKWASFIKNREPVSQAIEAQNA